LINRILNIKDDYLVGLADPSKIKKDCPVAIVNKEQLWKKEKLLVKFKSVLKLNYTPSIKVVRDTAKEIFKSEFFGTEQDLGPPLFELMLWFQNLEWELNDLTSIDWERADALEQMSKLNRQTEFTSPWLNMRLYPKQEVITPLVYPVVAKTPIRSIQYFVDVQSRFTFNSIRKSKHKYADDINSYLYEILTLNQKTANLLHNSVGFMHTIQTEKGESLMMKEELDAISNNDAIITYLKSSIEKIVYLVGYTFEITNLEGKKEHKKRLKVLDQEIPDFVKKQDYYQFFEEHISSKQLEQLNRYRTGVLHKKGLSKNQPHTFAGNKNSIEKLKEMFDFLFDQHCKNSVLLIAALSLLTDELIKLDYPDKMFFNIPYLKLTESIKKMKKSSKP